MYYPKDIEMSESEKSYRAESDFHILVSASEVLEDKERLEAVQEHAEKAKKSFNKVLSKDYLKKIGIK